MPDYSNPFQAYINERYGMNPNGLQYNIWGAYQNPNSSSNQFSINPVINSSNNNNNSDDDDDLWGLFGKNFAKGLLSDPIGGVASIWNTYNAWRNDRADLNMKKEYFNMHKDAYQNNERRTEQAFQEHRANRYGNML